VLPRGVDRGPQQWLGHLERVRGEPFDAIDLELGALWADVKVMPETATAGESP